MKLTRWDFPRTLRRLGTLSLGVDWMSPWVGTSTRDWFLSLVCLLWLWSVGMLADSLTSSIYSLQLILYLVRSLHHWFLILVSLPSCIPATGKIDDLLTAFCPIYKYSLSRYTFFSALCPSNLLWRWGTWNSSRRLFWLSVLPCRENGIGIW